MTITESGGRGLTIDELSVLQALAAISTGWVTPSRLLRGAHDRLSHMTKSGLGRTIGSLQRQELAMRRVNLGITEYKITRLGFTRATGKITPVTELPRTQVMTSTSQAAALAQLQQFQRPEVHKAEPAAPRGYESTCLHCEQEIRLVPGGHGMTWVHTASGTVAGVIRPVNGLETPVRDATNAELLAELAYRGISVIRTNPPFHGQ